MMISHRLVNLSSCKKNPNKLKEKSLKTQPFALRKDFFPRFPLGNKKLQKSLSSKIRHESVSGTLQKIFYYTFML